MAQTITEPIPLFNLALQHKALAKELSEAAVRVINSGKFILGPETSAFETEFAQTIGVKHCIACSSGASAIQIALGACGVGPGDEVITTAHTFIATTSSVSLAGAKFILADVDEETGSLSPEAVEKKITSRTKAILPVHIYGYPAKMTGMMDIANLQWGTNSTSKLGCYEYGSDTITISTIFQFSDPILLDYVMYHEMLHKKFKFESKNGRTLHHSPEFKRMEAKFPNHELMEKEISKLARRHRFSLKRAILSF